jgi:hypothetical protein
LIIAAVAIPCYKLPYANKQQNFYRNRLIYLFIDNLVRKKNNNENSIFKDIFPHLIIAAVPVAVPSYKGALCK